MNVNCKEGPRGVEARIQYGLNPINKYMICNLVRSTNDCLSGKKNKWLVVSS
jgi:hypothetical protein